MVHTLAGPWLRQVSWTVAWMCADAVAAAFVMAGAYLSQQHSLVDGHSRLSAVVLHS